MADAAKGEGQGHRDHWVEEEDVAALLGSLPDEAEGGVNAEVVPDFGIDLNSPGAASIQEAGGGGVTGDFGGVLGGGAAGGSLAEGFGHNRLPVDTKEGDAGDPVGELFGKSPGGGSSGTKSSGK